MAKPAKYDLVLLALSNFWPFSYVGPACMRHLRHHAVSWSLPSAEVTIEKAQYTVYMLRGYCW